MRVIRLASVRRRLARRPAVRRVAAAGAVAALVAGVVAVLPMTAAAAAPVFKVPFPCGQSWEGQTRSNHKPVNSVDFNRANDSGDPVVASAAGTVSVVRNLGNTSYGKYIVVSHGGGWHTTYAHLSAFKVRKGQKVRYGTVIGTVGTTGGSTGPHLHYEQRSGSTTVKAKFNGKTARYFGSRSYKSDNACDKPDPVRADVSATIGASEVEVDAKGKTVTVNVANHGPDAARGVALTLDLSAVGKQLQVTGISDKACRAGRDAKRFTVACSYGDLAKGAKKAVTLKLAPVKGAKPGAAGKIAVAVASKTSDGDRKNNADEVKLAVVGKAIDVVAGATDVGPVKPGKSAQLKWTFANRGTATVKGLTLAFKVPQYVSFDDDFADCTYSRDKREMVCEFPTLTLPAGSEIRYNSPGVQPVKVQVASNAPGPVSLGKGSFTVKAHGSVRALDKRGGGKSFAVAAARTAGATAKGTGNSASFVVTTSANPYDLAMAASDVEGAKGDTVSVNLTVANRGPADARGTVTITAPTGTELAGVPEGCTIGDDRRRAVCDGGDLTLAAGKAVTSHARFRITADSVGEDGTVMVRGTGAGTDKAEGNNTAPLKITVAGGDGGGLPVTGTQVSVIAATGIGLMLIGGAVLFLGRRRRLTP